jgi:serine-type D-Ala-D-Ala carboxypeptidase
MKWDPVSKMMAKGITDGVFPGAVLLCAKGPEILYHRAFGLADENQDRQVRNDAVFDLASLTKPLATAVAMMVLVQENRLDMETCLGDVLPINSESAKAVITMDMLLRHTSGLPAVREYFRDVARRPDPVQAINDLILREPLDTTPGQCQVYSDPGYMFLSWVIKTVTQTRLDRFVQDRVYTPLGIDDLFFIDLAAKTVPVCRDRLVSTRDCPWRGRVLTGEVEDENAWAAGGVQGHAGLFGDAASIHRLCLEILQAIEQQPTRILDPKVVAAFVKKHPGRTLVAGFDTPSETGSSAGRFFSTRSVGHLGFTGTSFWMDPESGLVVILLTNRVHPSRSNQKIKLFRPAVHDCIAKSFR